MNSTLIELAKNCPGTIISVKIEDLIEANNRLIESTKKELEDSISKKDKIVFLTREMVLEKLNVAPSTLWRWNKQGYLVPINVGGQRRYKSTDIDDILNGKK